MDLPLSRTVVPSLVWLPRTGSTNDVLVQAATGRDAASWPDPSVVVTDDQVAGRGRLGRTWTAPPGRTLAISVLFRPRGASGSPVPVDRFGLLPLVAGVAMARAAAEALGQDAGRALPASAVTVKWPNDVLIRERKVSGILAELLPDGLGLVIGAGVNLTLGESELPTPTATSLALAGASAVSPDAVLAAYLRELLGLYDRWLAHDGDAVASGLLDEVVRASGTLGRAVKVELPGGAVRAGVARTLDASGRLVVDVSDGPGDAGSRAVHSPLVVSAGDVTHLRHDDRGIKESR